jgi:hypothetical protein
MVFQVAVGFLYRGRALAVFQVTIRPEFVYLAYLQHAMLELFARLRRRMGLLPQ